MGERSFSLNSTNFIFSYTFDIPSLFLSKRSLLKCYSVFFLLHLGANRRNGRIAVEKTWARRSGKEISWKRRNVKKRRKGNCVFLKDEELSFFVHVFVQTCLLILVVIIFWFFSLTSFRYVIVGNHLRISCMSFLFYFYHLNQSIKLSHYLIEFKTMRWFYLLNWSLYSLGNVSYRII